VPARVLFNFVDLLLNLCSAGLADLHLGLDILANASLGAPHFLDFAVKVFGLLAERRKPAAIVGRIPPI